MSNYKQTQRELAMDDITWLLQKHCKNISESGSCALADYWELQTQSIEATTEKEKKERDKAIDEMVKKLPPEDVRAIEDFYEILNQGLHIMYANSLADEANGISGAGAFRREMEPTIKKYQDEQEKAQATKKTKWA